MEEKKRKQISGRHPPFYILLNSKKWQPWSRRESETFTWIPAKGIVEQLQFPCFSFLAFLFSTRTVCLYISLKRQKHGMFGQHGLVLRKSLSFGSVQQSLLHGSIKKKRKKRIFLVKRRRDRDLPTTFKRTALLILGSLLTWHSYLKKMKRKY